MNFEDNAVVVSLKIYLLMLNDGTKVALWHILLNSIKSDIVFYRYNRHFLLIAMCVKSFLLHVS